MSDKKVWFITGASRCVGLELDLSTSLAHEDA